jgi:carboxyl-terminal processing protease
MRSSRLALSCCLAAALSACGGSGAPPTAVTPTPSPAPAPAPSSTTPAPTPSPSPTPTPTPTTVSCSLSSKEDWALAQLNEWYLFPSLIDSSVKKTAYSSLQSYVDALVAPARAQNKDRYFTYVTSISAENALINSGQTAGFGIRLGYDTSANRVFIVESFENGPAYGQNIDRGDELLAINGTSVSSLMASGGPQAVVNALGPDTAGVQRTLSIQHYGGAQIDITLTKATYNMDPVSSRYGAKVINSGGTLYGYLNLRTFISTTADSELRNAFQQFQDQGITKVIVDLRYNGGGLLSVAKVLGSLMAANHVGDVFSYTTFRSSKSSNNSTDTFSSESSAIGSMKIAFIGSGGTASASELVMNAFPPYLANNVALIGSNTYGKPVGQIAQDLSACDTRFRIIAFKLENADHNGDYYNGLASTMPVTCQANDDITHQLGDPNESSVATALSWLGGASCTAIASAGTKTTQGVREERKLLQPNQPSATQWRIPGLF